MRKIVIIVSLLLPFLATAQTTYMDAFNEANGKFRWHFGMVGGTIGLQDGETMGCIGLNATIRGVYANFLFWGNGGGDKYSTHTFTSKTCYAYHFGYQVPLTMRWRVIPIAGYFRIGYDVTDGSHYHIDDSGLHNLTYEGDDIIKGFDYGAVVVYHIPSYTGSAIEFNFNLGITRHTLFAGVSMNINQ